MRTAGTRSGFTLVEIVVVVTVAGFIALALQQFHVQHRRFGGWQENRSSAHDAIRVASSLLSADLREALPAEGDVELLAADSLRVRSPGGFGFVCAVDEDNGILGLNRTAGRVPTDAADSLVFYASTGWRVSGIIGTRVPSLSCAHGQASPQLEVEMPAEEVTDVPVGAPVRVVRSRTYHLYRHEGASWLARSSVDGTEALVGPLVDDGLRFRLLDAADNETLDPTAVESVEIRLIVRSPSASSFGQRQADTLTAQFQGRNR